MKIDLKEKIKNLLKKDGLLSVPQMVSLLKTDKTTIYRNIKKLIESGEVRELNISNKFKTYEINFDNHHHVVCNNCGKILHFQIDKKALSKIIPEIKDFKIDDIEVIIKGHCLD
jgi:Fe2+ or Zn2+ uptake regulation protein